MKNKASSFLHRDRMDRRYNNGQRVTAVLLLPANSTYNLSGGYVWYFTRSKIVSWLSTSHPLWYPLAFSRSPCAQRFSSKLFQRTNTYKCEKSVLFFIRMRWFVPFHFATLVVYLMPFSIFIWFSSGSSFTLSISACV